MNSKSDVKFKLLLLSDSAAPHTRRWANWFSEHGVEVHVASFNKAKDSGYKNVKLHCLWTENQTLSLLTRAKKSFVVLSRLRRLVNELKPNVIHSHSLSSYAWSALILNLRPRIITPWGTDFIIDINESRFNYLISKFSLSTADFVTTDAKHFKSSLISMGVSKAKLAYVPFGTNLAIFQPKKRKQDKTKVTFISTRTLNPVHRVDDLINAIPKILAERPEAQFIIVGGGSKFEEYSTKIEKLKLRSKVKFTGMLTESELVSALQKSDIYISTSMYDAGLAASTAEAMACGLPVIHPNVADNRIWANHKGGRLYKVKDFSSLAQAAIDLLDNYEKRVSMGKRNRLRIEKYYNLDHNMNEMLKIYLQICNSGLND
jgi:glycosyltransferase involved in cell wall biosynthesis